MTSTTTTPSPSTRAARYYGKRDIRVEDIESPVPKSGHVIVKPAFVGICGSDLHEYIAGPFSTPQTPHPITNSKIPIVLGHEFSATVISVPPPSTSSPTTTTTSTTSTSTSTPAHHPAHDLIKPSTRVAILPTLSCNTCATCTGPPTPLPHLCSSLGFIGISDSHSGGLATTTSVPIESVYPLPESVSLRTAALVEPLAVAWHAVARSGIVPGEGEGEGGGDGVGVGGGEVQGKEEEEEKKTKETTVLILGAGPIGLALVLCLRARFATVNNNTNTNGQKKKNLHHTLKIILTEPSPLRRHTATAHFQADHVIDPLAQSPPSTVSLIRALTPSSEGVAAVFDCAGVEGALLVGCASLRARGVVVGVAVWEGGKGGGGGEGGPGAGVAGVMNSMVAKEARVVGCLGYTGEEFGEVIRAVGDGSLKPEGMITDVISLDDVVEKGFEALAKERDKHVKILIEM